MQIISRTEAKASGLTHYYTGRPCKHGHVSIRYVDGGCLECREERPYLQHYLYGTWYMMIKRCFDEDHNAYGTYGGRGITVCDEWLDVESGFEKFCSDMGDRPEGYTLDRIDPDGDYERLNCRWADKYTQQRNLRHSKIKEHQVYDVFKLHDDGNSMRKISKMYDISYPSIRRLILQREQYEARTRRDSEAAV